MINPAYFHRDSVLRLLAESKLNEKNKYYDISCYNSYDYEIASSDWHTMQFVSLTEEINPVITGFFEFKIDRGANIIHSCNFISFSDNKNHRFILIRDTERKLRELFNQGFRKVTFTVVVGNPVEKHYDRIKNIVIVGIQKDQVRLPDGKYYDLKIYELLNPTFYGRN